MLESKFILTGFADEIDSNTTVQFTEFNNLGISYYEPRGIDGKNISALSLDEARALKAKMDSFGIRASSIGSPIGKISILDNFDEHMEKLRHVIEVAHALESKYIRIFSFYYPEEDGPEKWRGAIMDRMNAMAELAEKSDVMLLHENEHKIYGETAERCLDIFREVNSPALRAVFDAGNFAFCGLEAYPHAFNLLHPYIEYLHIKDAEMAGKIVPPGYGAASIKEVLTDLAKDNRQYFVSLEPHLGFFDGLADLTSNPKFADIPQSGKDTFKLAYDCLLEVMNGIKA